jgi:hypothetical protein
MSELYKYLDDVPPLKGNQFYGNPMPPYYMKIIMGLF